MAYEQTPIIGLVGGVGCGKSAVARWLGDHVSAEVVDADAVGHAVLLRDDVKAQLLEAFGDEILADGMIDRSAVAARVFGDTPEHAADRQTLESIVHPVMRGVFEEAFQAARDSAKVELIVFDAAILLESGWQEAVDVIAFVDVPFDERLRRVTASRGWSEENLCSRESSQWPLDRKKAAADVVIDNSGTVEAAGRQLETYLCDHGHLPPANTVTPSTRQLIN